MSDYYRPLSVLVSLVGGLSLSLNGALADVAGGDSVATGQWNQWRGPHRDGRVDGDHWPESLEGLELRWRVELGEGYSGPLVVGNQVIVTESADKQTERALSLARTDGAQQWAASWPGDGKVPFFAARNGDWIRSTPLHDGEAVYVGGMEEVLVKLDAADGEEIWRVDFPQRFDSAIPDFGFVSSPLIAGDALYVQAANSIVKLDKATGDTVWRQLGESADIFSSGAFSSPVMSELAGRPQLVVQTREALVGLDPESGEVLWQQPVPNFRGMNILTPVVHRDHVLTSSYRNGTFLYRISAEDTGFRSQEIWKNKVQGYMSSPVLVGGHAYLHLGNGRLACIELATGEERWISKPFGKYWSIAVQEEKMLALDSGGDLLLLRASPQELELLDSRAISRQPTWGHLAVGGEEIYVRELRAVAAYRWTGGAIRQVAATDLYPPNTTK